MAHHKGGMKQGHQGKHKHAKGHHMGTHGSHEKARDKEEHTPAGKGNGGEGLGTGYDAPEKYSGSEDSSNTHCC